MTAPRISRRLAVSSTFAIATAMLVGKAPAAHAQSFNGTGTVVAGSASISTGSGTTDINISTSDVVINWAPTDTGGGTAPILFQNSGTTATFSSLSDFAVLNRILPTTPTRAVQFDGNVLARIGSSAPVPGGTVFFYSPGGIIASGSAVFDVGNLGLTSSNVAYDAVTGVFDPGGVVSFQVATDGSKVDILTGANLTATGYVAIVAPTVTNAGSINFAASSSNGAAAALVAANAADITFSPDGLFDITVTQGTAASGSALSNSGNIGGIAGSGLGASHRIYMVAVPQNQAITMAIASGSTLGFDIAGAADVDGNAVILSGGYNVIAGEVSPAQAGGGTGTVDINLTNTAVSSRYSSQATGTNTANATGGVTSFASDVEVIAKDNAGLFSQGVNGSLTVAGNAEITTIDPHTYIGASADAFGRDTFVSASAGGAIDISGDLTMTASALGGDAVSGPSGAGTGGTISVQSLGGGSSVHVGGLSNLNADGFSGFTSGPNDSSGNATGGQIRISAFGGNSTVNLDGDVSANARGIGGVAFGTGTAGAAQGGLIAIQGSGVGNGSTGNVVTLNGNFVANAFAVGGDGTSSAGNATGGQAFIVGDTGGAVSIGLQTVINAGGFGGNIGAAGTAGRGDGGGITISANPGGDLDFGDLVSAFAHGAGGSGIARPSIPGSVGGIGQGGVISFSASGGTIAANAGPTLDASGFGGDAEIGGNGTGGSAILQAFNSGSMDITSFDFAVSVAANGQAGAALGSGGRAGNGLGGTAQIVATTGGSIDIEALGVFVSAEGVQSQLLPADGTDGGNGTGGNASISQGDTASIVIVSDPIIVSTVGRGGNSLGGGDRIAGTGTGGDARIAVNGPGGINLTGNVTVDATGIAGDGIASTGRSSGGTATGGIANLGAGAGALTIAGSATTSALGLGGSAFVDGNGGAGTGGQAIVGVVTAAAPGSITIASGGPVRLDAQGVGGNANGTGTGGAGTGGFAQMFAAGGNVLVEDALTLTASGFGGGGSNALGGIGQGGNANLSANGFSLGLLSDVTVEAIGDGGSAIGTGSGGTGTGGQATLIAQNNGTANVGGIASFVASASGGYANNFNTNGGNATGGTAVVQVQTGGDLTFSGDLTVDAAAFGGVGDLNSGNGIGGNALGGGARILVGQGPVVDGGGGSIALASSAQVYAQAVGGDAGTAGNATGGNANVAAFNGTLTTAASSNLLIDATGLGGFGNAGGDGGDGTGGRATLFSGSSLNGGSTVTVDVVTVNSSGQGGFGNVGLNPGDTGGIGGDGIGGMSIVTAAAGNGNMTANFVNAQSVGVGGGGGDGRANLSGTGGTGGAGGIGTGGIINVGSESGTATPAGIGTASYGSIQINTSGLGGDGGNGGNGVTVGNGGDGGDAFDGAGILLVRGTPVTVTGTTSLSSNALGGDGGTGAVQGLGGDATVGGNGGFAVNVTNRFQVPTQRGTLTAGDILGTANAIGGTGSTSGQETVGDFAMQFNVVNSDLTATSVDLSTNATLLAPNLTPSLITVNGGSAVIAGRFGFATAGDLTLSIDNGSLRADTIDFFGHDWILPTAPVVNGTLTGTSLLNLASSNDLLSFANLVSSTSIGLASSGAIQFGDVTAGVSMFAQAQDSITLGTVNAAGTIDLLAGGNITTLGANSGNYINYESLGSVSTGALDSGQYIEIDSLGGPATTGNVQVGDYFTLQANGNVSIGNVTAGIVNPSTDPLATYNVGIAGNGNVTVGTIQARNDIGLLANNGTVTAGALTGRDMLLLATTGVTVNGGINATSRVGIANATFAALGGSFETFDKEPVFSALPFAIDTNSATTYGVAGPITINGDVNVQSLRAYSTSDFSVASGAGPGQINNVPAGAISIAAGGDISVASGVSGSFVLAIAAGSLTAGNITSLTTAGLFALTDTLTVGNILAFGEVLIGSGGAVTTGSIASDPVGGGLPAGSPSTVRIRGTSISTGSIFSNLDISLAAGQTITTGQVQSGTDTLLLAGTGLTVNGTIIAQGRLGIANATQVGLGGQFATFDPNLVFSGLPTAIDQTSAAAVGVAGPVALNGPVQASAFKAFSTGNLATTGSITTTNGLEIASGGSVTTGALSDGNRVIINSGGALNTNGGMVSGGVVSLLSGGAMSLSAISSNRAVILSSQTSVTTANINAADRIFIGSQGNVSTGNLVSDAVPFNVGSLANTVQIGSGGSISTGSIRSTQSVALAAAQDITVGAQINSRLDIALLAGQSVTTNGLLAGAVVSPTGGLTGANGRILIGNPSIIQSGGAGTIFNLDYNALFSAAPARVGGSVLLNGQVISLLTEAYSQGDLTAFGLVGFSRVEVESGGLVSVRGIWGSPQIEIRSNDIDIAAPSNSPTNPSSGGALRGIGSGLAPGEVDLVSLSQNPALIGDGLNGSGYSLSNAEMGRIITGTLLIGAVNSTGNLIDMLIGDLTINAAQAITSTTTTGAGAPITTITGGTINGPDGRVIFVTGDPATSTVGGGIKVVGDVAGTNFTSGNAVEFDTTLLEIDAATGSVKLANANNGLAGTIEVSAEHIHIAEADILAKLEADPFYVGHIADLNRPTAVSRPDGVFNAEGLEIFPASTVYIQNTGTALVPAGFLTILEVDNGPPDPTPTGGTELVINGQFVTDTGTLTGRAAFDALLAAQNQPVFSPQSQLNSCLFIGGCVSAEDPVASISSEIEMVSDSDLSDSPVVEDEPEESGGEEASEEEKAAEEDVDGSPIAPPAPLIDTRPLNPPVNVTEPVAGSGNPALIGSAVNEGTAQGDAQ